MSINNGDGIGHGKGINYVSANYETLRELPKEGVFSLATTGWDAGTIQSVKQNCIKYSLLREVDSIVVNGNRTRSVYTLTEKGRELIEYYTASSDAALMPCGHSGMKNLEDSEYYQCTTCQGRFTRDEIEQ
jgi:hypothetical protein